MSEQRVTPQFRMTRWDRTRYFYVEGLGFAVEWEHRFEPNFPVFAKVSRDRAVAGCSAALDTERRAALFDRVAPVLSSPRWRMHCA